MSEIIGKYYKKILDDKIYYASSRTNIVQNNYFEKAVILHEVDDLEKMTWLRDSVTLLEKDFMNDFIPCRLSVGDEIVCFCMGKKIAGFKVSSIAKGRVYYHNSSDNYSELTTKPEINSDGTVTVINNDTKLSHIDCVDYIYVGFRFKQKTEVFETLGKMSSESYNLIKDINFAKGCALKLDSFALLDLKKQIVNIRTNLNKLVEDGTRK